MFMSEDSLKHADESISTRGKRWLWSRVASSPPPLNKEYSRADYIQFMRSEVMLQSPAYARGRVRIHGLDNLLTALESSNVILGFLHHGSWLLIGGVIRHVLDLPHVHRSRHESGAL